MKTFLLLWSPKVFAWDRIEEDFQKFCKSGLTLSWSIGQRKRLPIGSRVFVMRVGQNPRGIVASGLTVSSPYRNANNDNNALSVKFKVDTFSLWPLIEHAELKRAISRKFIWTQQGSGIEIPTPVAEKLALVLKARQLPSAEAYVAAFKKIEHAMSDKQKALLIAQYNFPDHRATATELAKSVGEKTFRAVNSIYGKLGTAVRKAVGFAGPGQQSSVLSSFYRPDDGDDHDCQFVMHPQVVYALEQLGWVKPVVRKASGARMSGRPGVVPVESTQADVRATEGIRREVTQYVRGRSGKLRQAALANANGICEGCGKNFRKLLDGDGVRVLQVHHREQLSVLTAPTVNTVRDLAVVCANCHMLIHSDSKNALKVENLQQMLKGRL